MEYNTDLHTEFILLGYSNRKIAKIFGIYESKTCNLAKVIMNEIVKPGFKIINKEDSYGHESLKYVFLGDGPTIKDC